MCLRISASVAYKPSVHAHVSELRIPYTRLSTTNSVLLPLGYYKWRRGQKRQFRDKIPAAQDVEYKTIDEEVRDRDLQMKEKGKEYGDLKRRATDSHLEIGEKVLIKNVIKENKLTPNYNPTMHTVTGVRGGDICIRNDETGKEYRRNVIHLKKVNDAWTVINQDCSNNNLEENDELT
ncbi:uncharacterized protein LOC113506861 [Trichoplusia ni]|uniref:Uncharacterized protein LOC113506861 n=1 Tax=Trichoplusia ni TaxID=7111 RepID=A0A7E5WXC7_TRINI|nr:uncharacterized protein LOC113506861 [Trichoplusia ni]